MELTGDLSDFALTDILQILALSRKTGTLSVESGGLAGKVVIVQGRITYASILPGETLADKLIRDNQFSASVLGELRSIGCNDEGIWTLESLIVESGLMSDDDLKAVVKQHIQWVVGRLVALEKGRFGISLNEAGVGEALDDIAFSEGLDVSEALLGAAKESDEGGNQVEDMLGSIQNNGLYSNIGVINSMAQNLLSTSDNDYMTSSTIQRGGNGDVKVNNRQNDKPGDRYRVAEAKLIDSSRTSLLCSLLTELRSYSFEAEVILIIMRYASEVASRGVLFVVRANEICGLGQFGVTGRNDGTSADECVREIRLPLDRQTVFGEVAMSGVPYIGVVPDEGRHEEIFGSIGGIGGRTSMFVLPVVCQGRSVFIIYGDNYPSVVDFNGIDELLALVNQAGIILEKIVLERLLDEVQVNIRVPVADSF